MGLSTGRRAAVLFAFALGLHATGAAQDRLELQQTRYELRTGQPATLAASAETVDFMLNAKTRTVEVDGQPGGGLVAAPNRGRDRLLLAASARVKPGEHTVKITAVSESGETREATAEVVVDALQTVPSNSSRPPVVLLNGWEAGYTGICSIASASLDTFGNLAQYLVADGAPIVYLFDNCAEDPNQPIEVLGNDLSVFLNAIHYDNGSQVPQIDLVAHSMGGLIVRSYLAGLQPQAGVVLTPPTNTLVHKLVLIATPNFGSFIAGTYAANLAATPQAAELIPGSSFLWNLGTWNQFGDDLHGVNAIAVVGNAGIYNATVANASDGLVTMTSAALGFVAQQMSTTRIVPYCHVDPVVFTNLLLGTFQCVAPGIANVTDTNQLTGQIVRSFLAGNSTWSSTGSSPSADPYLSKDGGVLFGLLNSNGTYVTDITQVQWGTVMLNHGGDTNTIYYDDMVFGSAQYVATSTSLGTVTCAASADPVGYIAVTRCKFNATITSVSPEASGSGRNVTAGAALTLNGITFGTKCGNCKVTATPVSGASGAQTLTVTSWNNTAITVTLPATLSGLQTLTVFAATSTDSINVMAVSSTAAIGVSPSTLQFAYTSGGAVPAAQSVAISNSGSGALNWTVTSSASWLSASPASGTAPSTLSVSVDPSGMGAGTYPGTLQVAASGVSNSPATITVQLTVQAATGPTIAAVVNAASSQPGLASATWLSIYGTNLAAAVDSWQSSDFVNGALPTSLGGVSVTINGLPAYVDYVSSTQINVLAPDDGTAGAVQVQVTSAGQQSNSFTVQKAQFAPAFFMIGSGPYVAAQHADFSLVGSANLLPGVTTSPAVPGEVIQIYATGFGPTNPASPTGQLVTTPEPLANPVQVTIGGVAATVQYAGLSGSGLYQLNVTVPQISNGDAPVTATIGGVQTQTGALVTVQQ